VASARAASLTLAVGLLATGLLAGCALGPGASRQRGVSEHVRIVHGSNGATTVLLPVTIQGHGPYDFALDTGASKSLVAASIASRLGLRSAGPSEPIQGVGGVERAQPVAVSSWKTGSIDLPQMVVLAADMPSGRRGGGLQGLLGSDVWDAIGSFKLDYQNATLTVNPP
jgi:predicted aspartyl protease